MFKFYFAIGVMCVIFAAFSLLQSGNAGTLASIFIGMAGVSLSVGFITANPESRW